MRGDGCRAVRLMVGLGLMVVPVGAALAAEALRMEDDFEKDLSRWLLTGAHAITIVDSGDPAHGHVLQLTPDGVVHALVAGSDGWGALRVEADFRFPGEGNAYLGFVYDFTRTAARTDFGSLYVKADGSYIRANPFRDGNASRLLYEEYRTPLEGTDAVRAGSWSRLKAEVQGNMCDLYVGDMSVPKVTFPLFEGTAGLVGFNPRIVGAPVWIDNVRVTSIDRLTYTGPRRPEIAYHPEELWTDWEVLGPVSRPLPEVERDPAAGEHRIDGVSHAWRPFDVDLRGGVITGRVTEYDGDRPVAYFRAVLASDRERTVVLHFSTIDELALFVNGRMLSFVYRDGYVSDENDWNAWYDFASNPRHAGRRIPVSLVPGDNRIVVRVRNGEFASGGFFLKVEE